MSREVLQSLAGNVSRLLTAGCHVAAGDEGLARRARALREMGKAIPVLLPLAEAVERVVDSDFTEAPRRLLDLLLVVRQIDASLTTAGAEGELTPVPDSGPWATNLPTHAVEPIIDEINRRGGARREGLSPQSLRWELRGDLRAIGACEHTFSAKDPELARAVAAGHFSPTGPTHLADGRPSDDPMHQTQRELLSSVQRGELQGRQAALALGVVLCSRASELRELAARQMGRLWRQAEVVVPLLIAALQTDHGNVRAAAAEALGRLGPAATDAVPALEANASLHNGEVGALARDALASIRARQPVPIR